MTATQAAPSEPNFSDRRAVINTEIAKLKNRRAGLRLAGKKIPETVNDAILDFELELDALEDAEGLAGRRKRQEKEQAEADIHSKLIDQIAASAELYFSSVADAEKATREQADALKEAVNLLRKIKRLHQQAHERVPLGLSQPGWERRFSERISAVLKTVNHHPVRFGDLNFATSWRKPDENWTDSERKELAAMALPNSNKMEN